MVDPISNSSAAMSIAASQGTPSLVTVGSRRDQPLRLRLARLKATSGFT